MNRTIRLSVFAALLPAALALTAGAHARGPVGSEATPSCDTSGATDATQCLNAFFTALPDGSTVRLPKSATYRVEGTVTLDDKHQIRIYGSKALLYSTTLAGRSRAHLSVYRSSDIAIENLKVRGANTVPGFYLESVEGQHGVRIQGSLRVSLHRLTITNVWGDFVYVAKAVPVAGVFEPSSDVAITDSRFNGSGRQGIAVVGNTERVLIEDNDIYAAQRSIIDLEPGTRGEYVRDVTIQDNVVTPGHNNFVSAAVGGQVNNVAILDNVGKGKVLGVVIWDKNHVGRTNWLVAGNRSDRTFGSNNTGVVKAAGAEGVVVRDNTQPIQYRRKMVGLYAVNGTCGAVSLGNDLPEDGTGAQLPQLGGDSFGPCPKGTQSGLPTLPSVPQPP